MLTNLTIKDFMSTLASDSPVPGGGSVAAMCGAAASSLIAMVAALTVEKKGYEEAWDEMTVIKSKAEMLADEFLSSVDEDADSYAKVIDCYKMPKNTDDEKQRRSAAIQKAIIEAALLPLSVAERAVILFDYAKTVVDKGNKNAASDGAVGAVMARSCVLGALYNVRINADLIKDETVKKELLNKAERLEKEAISREQEVLTMLSF